MEPTTLVLVRHAHCEENIAGLSSRLCGWFNPPLTGLGQAQVQALRERLAGEPPPAALYTSPLERARRTAEAAPGPAHPAPVAMLKEIHCGDLDGMPLSVVQEQYPELW